MKAPIPWAPAYKFLEERVGKDMAQVICKMVHQDWVTWRENINKVHSEFPFEEAMIIFNHRYLGSDRHIYLQIYRVIIAGNKQWWRKLFPSARLPSNYRWQVIEQYHKKYGWLHRHYKNNRLIDVGHLYLRKDPTIRYNRRILIFPLEWESVREQFIIEYFASDMLGKYWILYSLLVGWRCCLWISRQRATFQLEKLGIALSKEPLS